MLVLVLGKVRGVACETLGPLLPGGIAAMQNPEALKATPATLQAQDGQLA